ncbi:hypothetical protein C8J57DRAFT_1729478, partial [Mycena rebaudengoi]
MPFSRFLSLPPVAVLYPMRPNPKPAVHGHSITVNVHSGVLRSITDWLNPRADMPSRMAAAISTMGTDLPALNAHGNAQRGGSSTSVRATANEANVLCLRCGAMRRASRTQTPDSTQRSSHRQFVRAFVTHGEPNHACL